jgi:peptide/nickel transport system ATP-binding protein/oligopeptide transport system ATP-binding protein
MLDLAVAASSTFAGRAAEDILVIRDLVTTFHGREGVVRANDHVDLDVPRGTTLGIVGESGSGKSVLCRSILRLLPPTAHATIEGSVLYDGRDLLRLDEAAMRRLRASEIRMVFQNPMTSLNPVWPIGDQVTEGLRLFGGLSARAARARGIELLGRVGIPSPERRIDDYPHQWSGGMLQRAVIAMAMAAEPRLLLADEPTTALDVTIQDQILALLLDLQERTGMTLILVSHDLAIVAETCDRIAVMYAGRIVETAPVKTIFDAPRHPYTLGLLGSIPHISGGASRLKPIAGQPPDLARLGGGCPFAPRCAFASPDCRVRPVPLARVGPDHLSACLYPERVAGASVV